MPNESGMEYGGEFDFREPTPRDADDELRVNVTAGPNGAEPDEIIAARICGRRGCSNFVAVDYPYHWCQDCQNEKCDHGNPPHDCDECCRESDFEYDKQREQRFFQ